MPTKRVLIIDDEDAVREIMQLCLETIAGWEVLTAASATEGLAIAAASQPDAILLDMMMPDMDGVMAFGRLQANALTQNIPTIFVTAKVRSSEQQQFSDMGITGVINKPFKATDLIDQIRDILNWKD